MARYSIIKIQFLSLVCILVSCSYPNLRHIRTLSMTPQGRPIIQDSKEDDDNDDQKMKKEHNFQKSDVAMFDTITQMLYNQASRPVMSTRQKFNISAWMTASAEGSSSIGLNNTDRKMLGDIFYNSTSLFEYGLGESTAMAGHVGIPRYSGVGSDIEWLHHIRSNMYTQYNSGMDHFRYFFADIGDLLHDGNPVKAKLQKNTYDYQIAPLLLESRAFDTYFINGIGGSRYRMECLCVAMLHAMKYIQGGEDDITKVKFIIHNINSEHDETIQEFANVVGQTNKLRVYNLKDDATEEIIFDTWTDAVVTKPVLTITLNETVSTNSTTHEDIIALNGTNSTNNGDAIALNRTNSTNEETVALKMTNSSTHEGNSSRRVNEEQNASKFDMIARILFDKASSPVIANHRNRFDLIGHRQKDMGRLPLRGFNDKDRVVLGHQFFDANSVFQYGLGESTIIATHTSVPRYTAVDSDPRHISFIRNNSAFTMDHFRFTLADIGETGKGGKPDNSTLSKIEFDYQVAPLVLERKAFDFYFIDGRYRVACACISFLHAMKYGADMTKVKIGMHVNSQKFKGYEVLKDIADRIEEGDDQWVYIYQLKKKTTEEDLFRLWMNYRLVIS